MGAGNAHNSVANRRRRLEARMGGCMQDNWWFDQVFWWLFALALIAACLRCRRLPSWLWLLAIGLCGLPLSGALRVRSFCDMRAHESTSTSSGRALMLLVSSGLYYCAWVVVAVGWIATLRDVSRSIKTSAEGAGPG